jgi:hypothetical protein
LRRPPSALFPLTLPLPRRSSPASLLDTLSQSPEPATPPRDQRCGGRESKAHPAKKNFSSEPGNPARPPRGQRENSAKLARKSRSTRKNNKVNQQDKPAKKVLRKSPKTRLQTLRPRLPPPPATAHRLPKPSNTNPSLTDWAASGLTPPTPHPSPALPPRSPWTICRKILTPPSRPAKTQSGRQAPLLPLIQEMESRKPPPLRPMLAILPLRIQLHLQQAATKNPKPAPLTRSRFRIQTNPSRTFGYRECTRRVTSLL